MKASQLVLSLLLAATLAACSSTSPTNTAGNGANGANGANGLNGANGENDPSAAGYVRNGVGVNGVNGANGANGATGADGSGAYSNSALKDPRNILSKRSVYFDFDSATVKGEYKPLVEAHSTFLKKNPQRKAQIQGNTDVLGSREYNLALGQRRAESVKNMMRVLGVPEGQLEAVSYGKEKPKATGTSDADNAQNRRADVAYDGE